MFACLCLYVCICVDIDIDMSIDNIDIVLDLSSNKTRQHHADGPAQRRGVRDGYKLMSIGGLDSKQIV